MGRALDHAGFIFPRGYLHGLTLSTAGSTATFGVAAGEALDSTFSALMTLGSAYTKTTSAWAVGTGNGAMDTGAVAINTWYHVYLIKRPDTGVVDVLFSLSATAPTLPANYTVFRRIGSMKTDGSSQWVAFTQLGDEFIWAQPLQDIGGSGLNGGTILFTINVPPGVSVTAKVFYEMTTTSGTAAMFLSSPLIAAATAALYMCLTTTAANCGQAQIVTNTSQQIRCTANASGGTQATYISTQGWLDTRGKLL